MVGTRPGPAITLVASVFGRLGSCSHRFLSVDDHGRFTVRLDRLAEVVSEIVTEHTTPLRAELDTAEGFIEELECDLVAARGRLAAVCGRLAAVNAGGEGR